MVEYNLYIGTGKYNKKETETLIKSLADKFFIGYTLIETTGVWKGKREDSFILQVICVGLGQINEILALNSVLKEELNQECVMLTYHDVKMEFI